jgi:hypothetical protein
VESTEVPIGIIGKVVASFRVLASGKAEAGRLLKYEVKKLFHPDTLLGGFNGLSTLMCNRTKDYNPPQLLPRQGNV